MKAQSKAILASLVVIALALTAVSGVTYSWFSDFEQNDIDVSTAIVDMDVEFGTPTSSSNYTEIRMISDGKYSISGMAANFTGTIPVNSIVNNSNIDTVFRQAVNITITETSNLTQHDLSNILVNSVSLENMGITVGSGSTAVAGVYEYGFEWASLESGVAPDVEGFVVTTTTSYGDGQDQSKSRSFSIEFTYQMYQGDYPYQTLDSTGSAKIPDNKVVSGTASTSEGATEFNAVVDFSDVTTESSTSSAITDMTVNVSSLSSATLGEYEIQSGDDVVIASLSLSNSTGSIDSADFNGKYVIVSIVLDGDYSDCAVVYTGTDGDQPILVSSTYANGKTTVIFKTNHFSTFAIIERQATINTETGLRLAMLAGFDVVLSADITTTGKSFAVGEWADMTLDLAGFDITAPMEDNAIVNYGSLTIVDSSGKNDGKVTYGIDNEGTLVIESGTIVGSEWIDDSTTYGRARAAVYSGVDATSVTITGGVFETPVRAVHIFGGTAKITGTSDSYIEFSNSKKDWNCIKAGSGTEISMQYVRITSTNGGPVEAAGGNITVDDCEFIQGSNPGLTWNSMLAAASGQGTLTINSGTFTTTYYGIYVYNSGATININGGTFTSTSSTLPMFKLDSTGATAPAKMNVNGGTFDYNVFAQLQNNTSCELSIASGSFSSDPSEYVSPECSVVEEDGRFVVNSAASIGGVGYASFLKALEAAEEGDVIDIHTDKVDLVNAHVNIPCSITINANGADFGNKDLSVETYLSFTKETTIIVNDAKNLYLWGERKTNNVVNIEMNNCSNTGTSAIIQTGRMVYLSSPDGVSYTNNITLNGCSVTSCDSPVYSNADGIIKITGCTFTDCAVPINFNHKSAGTQTVEVKNSEFERCGSTTSMSAGIATYSAPLRALNTYNGGSTIIYIEGCIFNGSLGDNGDILLYENRAGSSYDADRFSVTGWIKGCTSDDGSILVKYWNGTEAVEKTLASSEDLTLPETTA